MKTHFPQLGIFITLLALAAPRAISAVRVNLASLQHWPTAFQLSTTGRPAPEPPPTHPRVVYWQAAQARYAADWDTVLALMKPLAANGDRYALQFVGLAYESRGDYLPAVNVWEQLGNADALVRVGKAAEQAGQASVALQAYAAAWKIDPRIATSPYAGFLERSGDLAAAERLIRDGLASISPSNREVPYLYLKLAKLLMKQERWGEAVQTWEDVLRTAHLFYSPETKMAQAYYEMSWAYHMNGQNQKAAEAIERAVEQNPTASYFIRAGQIYEAAGQVEKALRAYRQALIIDPDNQTALQAIQRMDADQ